MLHFSQERLIVRPYRNMDDFWRVRQFLIATYPLTPPDFNWEIRRWEGWHFHNPDTMWNPGWEALIRLWETADGRLVGVVHPEGEGDAFLEIHPDYRTTVEEEMVAWAEDCLTIPTADSRGRQLQMQVFEYDSPRRRLLEKRGYEKTSDGWVVRRLRLGDRPLPESNLASGYMLRSIRPDDMGDCQGIADILNAAFNRTFHNADEFHVFSTRAPSFRYDLHLVAEAMDGSFAAHVGVTYDEVNRRGIYEPVCTHPDHRRKGLARTLMFEGLHRLKRLGATDVYVATGDDVAANELYESVGFTEAYKGYIWRKWF
jgi:mycothiol synthase